MNEKILSKILNEKYDSLAKREKEIVINHMIGLMTNHSEYENKKQLTSNLFQQLNKNDNNCISIFYGCKGGFIIHRAFSPEYKKEFRIVITDKNLEDFIQELPVKEKSGATLNFYKLLESTIGIKLKVRNAFKLGGMEKGLGVGILKIDAFELIIAKDDDIESVVEDMRDIFKLNSKLNSIEKENIDLKKIVHSLKKLQKPIIISEGKTDWKHFISALRYFHSKNEFKSITDDIFLKYGSEEDKLNNICDTDFILECSVTELNKILSSFVDSSKFNNNDNQNIKIGIFDSDDSSAKIFKDKNSNTYSFKIEPNNISTEMLYSDNEIMSIVENRRLYLGTEFNEKTKKHLIEKNINLGGQRNSTINKAGKRKIIDCDVFDEKDENIALTKEDFAQKIYLGQIKISDKSWENFRHIFDFIKSVIE